MSKLLERPPSLVYLARLREGQPNETIWKIGRVAMRKRTAEGGGLDQEGSVERVKVRWRMLRRRDDGPEYFCCPRNLGHGQGFCRNQERSAQRSVKARQKACCLRGDHFLAAVVVVISRIARHRLAAFHRLLVSGHGLAFRELHQQKNTHRNDERCDLAKHPAVSLTTHPS